MFATLLRTFVFLLFPAVLFGQSLTISETEETAGNSSSDFLMAEGQISIDDQTIQFSGTDNQVSYDVFGISADRSLVAALQWDGEEGGEISLFNSSGVELLSFETISIADEASFGLYPFSNGSTILRDKIANFTFYDSFGEVLTSMSSSSQSEEGEAISEVAMSENGQTVVVYNPKIKRDGQLGSKAQVKAGEDEFIDIFGSSDRYLKDMTLSDDGSLIVAITASEGANDEVLVMDKYGNELNTLSAEEDLQGAALSNDLNYLTLYSGGRVMVYSTLEGESLGATSVSSPIKVANYFPEDNTIVVLTGNYSDQSNILNSATFRAINLEQRSIASEEYSAPLGFNDSISAKIIRNASNSYQLKGVSKELDISVRF